MDEMISPAPQAVASVSSALRFVVEDQTGELQSIYAPRDGVPAPTRAAFDEALAATAYAGYHLDADAVATFLKLAESAKQAMHAVVGSRRDAECRIAVADDFMSASLTLIAAEGGAAAGPLVEAALREQGIVHGIDHTALDAALAAGQCDGAVIARGTPPREGVPAHFECLLQDRRQALEQLDENAVIKYADLGHLLLVQPGAKLMRRTAPVQGANGIDIFGAVAFPKPLPAMEFGANFAGAVTDPDDPDTLLAAIAGQPVVYDNGVVVNPVIEVEHVDLGTGNIQFDGTIKVSGDIKSGMKVKVSGDVIVGGVMEAADVQAGGNVAVAGGILGRADSHPGATRLPPDTARIKCGGSVQAQFVESAHIEAGDSIVIERNARQCELTALNDIVVGAGRSKAGQLVGGVAMAKHLIRVSILGSNTGVKTRVQIGVDPYAEESLAEAKKQLEQKNAEFDRILQITVVLRQNPKKGEGGVAEKVNGARTRLLDEIEELGERIKTIAAALEVDEDARLQVDKAVFFGSEVKIGSQIWNAPDDMRGTTLGMVEGRIATGLAPRPVARATTPGAEDAPGQAPAKGGFG